MKGNKYSVETENGASKSNSIYDFEAKDIDGITVPLSKYRYGHYLFVYIILTGQRSKFIYLMLRR